MGLQKNTLSSDVTSGTPATATEYNNVRKDSRLNIKDLYNDSDGPTITMDLSQAAIHNVVLGGNRTIAFSNPIVGQHYRVEVVQPSSFSGGGPYTVTWPSTITWPNHNTTPTLSTLVNQKDSFIFYCTSLTGGPGSTPTYDGYIAGLGLG